MSEINSQDPVTWNFASYLNQELARLRSQANRSFVMRNLPNACENLMAIRHSISQVLSPETLKEFVKMEDELLSLSAQLQLEPIGFEEDIFRKKRAEALTKLYMAYRNYNDKIQVCLDSAGFLGARKQDASKLTFE